MSLDISPTNLWQETQGALRNTRNHLKSYSRQIKQYYGKHYLGGDMGESAASGSEGMRIENHAHDWLSTVLGRMVYDNPAVKVGTKRPAQQARQALLSHYGLNRWITDRNFVEEFELCVRDQQFNWGVALVSMEPIPDARPDEYVGGIDGNVRKRKEGVPWSPSFYRISQRRYFWDPLAGSSREKRFEGHIWTRSKGSLAAEAKEYPDRGWNLDLIEKISTDASEHRKDLGRQSSDKLEIPDRDEIVGVTIWVKDRQIEGKKREDNFYGTLYTIALDPVAAGGMDGSEDSRWEGIRKELEADGGKYKKQYLREPYAFYGPPTGPYEVGVVYTVPDDPAGLGPLTVSQEAADELNLVSAANTASAKRWKRGVVVGGVDKKMAQQIKSGLHDGVLYSAKFTKSDLSEWQVAGLDPQSLAQEERMASKLERSQGLSDAQRGQVTGKGTATEVYQAAQAGNARMDYIEKKVYRFAQNILRKVLWYMWHSDKVVIQLGPDVAEDLGFQPTEMVDDEGMVQVDEDGMPVMIAPEIQYQGGPGEDGESETAFDDLELTIKPYSMQRTDEGAEQANTMAWIQFLLQAAPMVRQFPEINFEDIFEAVANSFNQADGGQMVDVAMGKEIGAMMMGLELQQQELATNGETAPQFAGYAGLSKAPTGGGVGGARNPMEQGGGFGSSSNDSGMVQPMRGTG